MDDTRLASLLCRYHDGLRSGSLQTDAYPTLSWELASCEARQFRIAQRCLDQLDEALARSGTDPLTRESASAPGELLPSRRYRGRRRIGSGGMGIVYEAFDRERQERVALKTMRRGDPHSVAGLKAEFRTLADTRHPNLVALHELHCAQDRWFFSMEFISGQRFTQFFRQPATVISLREAVSQLLSGLDALHQGGWLHRDIKPSNVLITETGRVVILDFGLRAPLGAARDGSVPPAGTWAYMSPEQAAGKPLHPASDLYSVGVMLYELLAGRLPFDPASDPFLLGKQLGDPSLPACHGWQHEDEMRDLCMSLLHRDPAARPDLRTLQDRVASGTQGRRCQGLKSASFVGRAHELARLQAAYHEVLKGAPRQVFLRGRSGLGKTTLAHSFLEQLQASPVLVLAGRCYETDAVPYNAWDELVDSLVPVLKGNDVADLIPDGDWSALLKLFPSLGQVRSSVREVSSVVEPIHERRRAFRAFRELLRRLGDVRPIVLFIDDIHWGDADSARLLEEILSGPEPPRLLVLATYRVEEEDTSLFLQARRRCLVEQDPGVPAEAMDIDVLSPDDAEQLVTDMLAQSSILCPQSVAKILRESGGHPWLIVTLSQELIRGDTTQRLQSISSLEGVLADRMQGLPAASRRLLQVVCAASHPVAESTAYRVADLDQDRNAACSELHRAHLIRHTLYAGQVRLAPYHDRIRDVCMRSLGRLGRRRMHFRLAQTLQAEDLVDHESIANHYRAAGVRNRAAWHYCVAADRARESLAFELAAECLRRALEFGQRSASQEILLREKRAEALAHAGLTADSAAEYQVAAELARDSTVERRLRRRAAYQLCVGGRIEAGKAEYTRVLQPMGMNFHASAWNLALRALALRQGISWRGVAFRRRDPERMDPELRERIDLTWEVALGMTMIDTLQGAYFQAKNLLLALRGGDVYRIARACAWYATHVSTAGIAGARQSRQLLRVADQLGGELDDPYLDGLCTLAHGIVSYFSGDWSSSSDSCAAATALFRDECRGTSWEITTSRAFQLWALFFQGDVRAMQQQLPVYLEDAVQRGDLLAKASLTSFGGPIVWLAEDDPARAMAELRQAMQVWPRGDFHVQHFTALAGEVQILLYRGLAVEAWSTLERQWPALSRSFYLHVEAIRVFMWHLRGRCAMAVGMRQRSPAHLRRAAKAALRLEAERAAWARPLARLLRAGIASAEADADLARKHLDAAVPDLKQHALGLFATASELGLADLTGDEALRQTMTSRLVDAGIQAPRRMAFLHVPLALPPRAVC